MTCVDVYEILSDEEWNGQNSPSDFSEVEFLATFDSLHDYFASEYYGREDIVYELREVW